jgi:hypothetical protein
MLGINAARERIADISERDFLALGTKSSKIRQRQPETDRTEIIENLAIAVDARKTADDILLRLLRIRPRSVPWRGIP